MSIIQRIFETHISVRHLENSMGFYENILGLKLGAKDTTRRIAFYWVGGVNVSMLGLWEKPAELVIPQHFAFQINLTDFEPALALLKNAQIKAYNFLQDGSEQPMVFSWMPAIAIYFRDPDGHELEFIAPLPDKPRPELGILSLENWQTLSNN